MVFFNFRLQWLQKTLFFQCYLHTRYANHCFYNDFRILWQRLVCMSWSVFRVLPGPPGFLCFGWLSRSTLKSWFSLLIFVDFALRRPRALFGHLPGPPAGGRGNSRKLDIFGFHCKINWFCIIFLRCWRIECLVYAKRMICLKKAFTPMKNTVFFIMFL